MNIPGTLLLSGAAVKTCFS